MFRPNTRCRILLASGKNDVHGQPKPGRYISEACSVVKLLITMEKSTVRADSSASRGNALEIQADAVILLTTFTQATINDIIDMAGREYRIRGLHPRYDAAGRLDHYEAHCGIWSSGK